MHRNHDFCCEKKKPETPIDAGNTVWRLPFFCGMPERIPRRQREETAAGFIEAADFSEGKADFLLPEEGRFSAMRLQGIRAFISGLPCNQKQRRQSFPTPGDSYDHSVCESLFHVPKSEAMYRCLYQMPLELKAASKEYLHFFNEERPHRK